VAENALLRQQLIILSRQVKRPAYAKTDRMLLVLLARMVQAWKQAHITRSARDAPPLASPGIQSLGLGKQVEKGDQKVGSAINAWGLLGRGLKGFDRNRRVSNSLSPIFYLFLAPSGVLNQKVQHLLAENETPEGSHPPDVIKHRRPGPKHPTYGIPLSE
jgi:hypothetical protein